MQKQQIKFLQTKEKPKEWALNWSIETVAWLEGEEKCLIIEKKIDFD